VTSPRSRFRTPATRSEISTALVLPERFRPGVVTQGRTKGHAMICRAIGAVLLLTAPSLATPKQWKVRYEAPACISQGIMEKVAKLHAEDAEAWVKLLTPMLLFNQCIMLDRAEIVTGEVGPFTGYVKVRRQGNPTEYIVARDTLLEK
jgi:hypothetical protein